MNPQTTPESPKTELQEVSAKLTSLYAKHRGGKLSKEHTDLMEKLEKRFKELDTNPNSEETRT